MSRHIWVNMVPEIHLSHWIPPPLQIATELNSKKSPIPNQWEIFGTENKIWREKTSPMSGGWRRAIGNARSFVGNSMGGLRGGSSLASWAVAGTLAYFLWVRPSQQLKREQEVETQSYLCLICPFPPNFSICFEFAGTSCVGGGVRFLPVCWEEETDSRSSG